MTDNDDTLLASLTHRLAGAVEDTATDALAYILNKSAGCRRALADLVGDGSFELRLLTHAVTQIAPENTGRLDLVAYDDSGSLRLIIESKFWAPLLDGQASEYVDYLDCAAPAVLLFVAPEVRHVGLLSKINQQFDESAAKSLGRVREGVGMKYAQVSDSNKPDSHIRVAMTSWGTLLDVLHEADVTTADDARQLMGLARAQDDAAFLPLHAEELRATIARRMLDFNRIVDDVVDAHGVHHGWMTTKGLKATPQRDGFLRYFRFRSQHGNRLSSDIALYVSCEQWVKSGTTPLWLRIGSNQAAEIAAIRVRSDFEHAWSPGNHMWIPLHLPTDAEYADVLEHVVGQVESVRKAVLPDHDETGTTVQAAEDTGSADPADPTVEPSSPADDIM